MLGEHVSRTYPTEPTWRRPRFSLRSLLVLVGLSACVFGLWRAMTARKPAPVTGIVTFNGQPLASGLIFFEPLDPAGRRAAGSIVNGKYVVKPGVVPGTYGVGVRSGGNAIATRYSQPGASGLSVRIPDAKAMTLHFDLR